MKPADVHASPLAGRFRLAGMGFLQVVFIAMNTVFIAQSALLSNLLTAFMISWIWSSNVKRIAIGDGRDRLFYAGGAALGSVAGTPDRARADRGRAMTGRVQHLVNVSGGKDSTAVYLLAIESGRPFRAVFADTGNEHEAVYEYLERLPERTGGPKVETVRADFTRQLAQHRAYILERWPQEGIADEIVQQAAALHDPTGNPFLDLCISKGRFPSRMAQFCTGELKETPIIEQVVLPMLGNGPLLQWLGIRADESARRALQPRFNRHESGCYLWRPILRWTVEDVWRQHAKHGLPRNPLYDQGMGRVGCMPCINCRKEELRQIAARFPEHIDRIEQWEAIVAAANKRRSATFFPAVTDPTDTDRPGTYSRIRTLVEWAQTSRGGRQFAMFFDDQAGSGCTSDLALCEVAP